jgi:predicted ATPase/DNA-binding SARP family transcriptional activator
MGGSSVDDAQARLNGGGRRLIELGILGPLEVRRDGERVEPKAAKERALLTLLLLRPGEVVSRDRLVEELWGTERPETADHALQVYVSNLRRALGRDAIMTRAGGYALALDPGTVDAVRFQRLVERGRAELGRDPDAAAETLREALALWRGPALADVAYEEFAQAEIARLEELRLIALEERVEADLRLGRHGALVAELESLVTEHPLRERLRSQLMLALYRGGRQADALEAYQSARETLLEELGLEPSSELRELQAAILRQESSLDVEPAEVRARRHLPTPATAFVGRREELASVLERFREGRARLVTLTGPGGSGKTRLALQAAHELAPDYADGVYFVDLAPVADPTQLEEAIANALGVPDSSQLGADLEQRQVLLLLDNFEQIEAAAVTVGELLRGGSQLAVLVTSRSPLRIYGEHVFAVPPLAEDDASELFVARALAAGRSIERSAAVDALCTWLDRLPLAIELVAARARELSPEQVLRELPPRLEVAAAGPRDVPARQRTLRATIDWSYGLLPEAEQLVLSRLAIFAGGFTPEAAGAVGEAELSHLAALAAASLAVEVETTIDEPRLTLLETVREYALARLDERGEGTTLRRRHAEHFLELAQESKHQLEADAEQASALARIALEQDNLNAALGWFASAGEVEPELRLATALKSFWWVRGHLAEGRRWLEGALSRADDVSPALRAEALSTLALLAYRQGDFAVAKEAWEQSLALYRELGDTTGIGRSIGELGSIALSEEDYERAVSLYEESAALFRSTDDRLRLATVLANLGAIANMQGEYARGRTLGEEALELNREIGANDNVALTLHNLGRGALLEGRSRDAAELLSESLELAWELGYRELIAYGLGGLAELAAGREDAERGAVLVGAADALFEELGVALAADDRESYESTVRGLTERLGEQTFEKRRAEGRTLELERAVELALERNASPAG